VLFSFPFRTSQHRAMHRDLPGGRYTILRENTRSKDVIQSMGRKVTLARIGGAGARDAGDQPAIEHDSEVAMGSIASVDSQ